jgi:hypothetical protein
VPRRTPPHVCRPVYLDSADPYDLNVAVQLQQELDAVMWQYRVNVALYGHHHTAQRLSAVVHQTVVQRSQEVEVGEGDNATTVHRFRNPQVSGRGCRAAPDAPNPPPPSLSRCPRHRPRFTSSSARAARSCGPTTTPATRSRGASA